MPAERGCHMTWRPSQAALSDKPCLAVQSLFEPRQASRGLADALREMNMSRAEVQPLQCTSEEEAQTPPSRVVDERCREETLRLDSNAVGGSDFATRSTSASRTQEQMEAVLASESQKINGFETK